MLSLVARVVLGEQVLEVLDLLGMKARHRYFAAVIK
jgi:hypothetical protein